MGVWNYITHPHMIYQAAEVDWRWFVSFWLIMLVFQVSSLTRQVQKLREKTKC